MRITSGGMDTSLDTVEKENTIKILPFVEIKRDQLKACVLLQWLRKSSGQVLSGSKGGKDGERGFSKLSPLLLNSGSSPSVKWDNSMPTSSFARKCKSP